MNTQFNIGLVMAKVHMSEFMDTQLNVGSIVVEIEMKAGT